MWLIQFSDLCYTLASKATQLKAEISRITYRNQNGFPRMQTFLPVQRVKKLSTNTCKKSLGSFFEPEIPFE